MQVYQVGGSVRDMLLGREAIDKDYVVVGSSPEEMLSLGFTQVGKDFPVFLHPETRDEYALARVERKVCAGYTGFTCDTEGVTLEQDLSRRDLTINAIAMDEHGNVIDPLNGVADLRAGILRHAGPAFVEDPVRVLRLARFAARYGFAVAPETMAFCWDMVEAGELDSLVAERVWQELAKGLMEDTPSRMFYTLWETGALAKVLPEVDALFGVPQPAAHHPEVDTGVHVMMALDYAAQAGYDLATRYAVLVHDLGKGITPKDQWPRHHDHEERGVDLVQQVSTRYRVPADCRDMGRLVAKLHTKVHRSLDLKVTTVVKMLKEMDAHRRPERFNAMLDACACDARGRLGLSEAPYPQRGYLKMALAAANTVDQGEIAAGAPRKEIIPELVYQARVSAVKKCVAARTPG